MIYSNEHRMWWRPNYCGYTLMQKHAGIFDYDEAIKRYPKIGFDTTEEDFFVQLPDEPFECNTSKYKTLREYIGNSSSAWISYEFDIDRISETSFKEYRCTSVDDFIKKYGTTRESILDDYYVIDTESSVGSQSQGSTYWLTVKSKYQL